MEKMEPKEFLLKYGHWTALGFSVLLILLSLIFGGNSEISAQLKEIEEAETEVATTKSKPKKTAPIEPYCQILKANWTKLAYLVEINKKVNVEEQMTEMSDIIAKELKPPRESKEIKEIFLLQERVGSNPDTIASELQKRQINLKPEQIKEILALAECMKIELKSLTAKPGPKNQSLYREPRLIHKKKPAPAQQYINKPANMEVNIEEDKISIVWSAPEELPKRPANQSLTKIDGYFLLKEWQDKKGKYKKYIEINGNGDTSYTDFAIESKIDYTYKICAYTNNSKAREGNKVSLDVISNLEISKETQKALNAKKMSVDEWLSSIVISEYTSEQKGYIESRYKLEVIGGSEKVATLKLKKLEKGAWLEITLKVKENEKIEGIYKLKDKGREIHFDPNWILRKIMPSYEIKSYLSKSVYVKDIASMSQFILKGNYDKELDEGKIGEELKEEFRKKKKIKLSSPAVIPLDGKEWVLDKDTKQKCPMIGGSLIASVVQDRSNIKVNLINPTPWLIKDGENFYVLVKENDGIKVYDTKSSKEYTYKDEHDKVVYVKHDIMTLRPQKIAFAVTYEDEKTGELFTIYKGQEEDEKATKK